MKNPKSADWLKTLIKRNWDYAKLTVGFRVSSWAKWKCSLFDPKLSRNFTQILFKFSLHTDSSVCIGLCKYKTGFSFVANALYDVIILQSLRRKPLPHPIIALFFILAKTYTWSWSWPLWYWICMGIIFWMVSFWVKNNWSKSLFYPELLNT